MSSPSGFAPQEALLAQERLAAHMERERRRASSHAVPLGLFGVLSLIAAGIAATGHWVALAVFWSIVGPGGGFFLAWYFARRDLRLRFERPPVPEMVVTTIGLVGGALALGWAGGGNIAFFAVGSGYVLFAAATGNRTTFAAGVAITAVTFLALIDELTTATGLSEVARTTMLTAAVGIVQLAAAAREIRRTRGAAPRDAS